MVATTTEQLNQLAATTVIVHPLVLLSVADHHARTLSRNSTKRVIGVLLGQDNGTTINVANSFGIPFEEDEKDPKTWFLDHNYIEGMFGMFRKVNARERLIGWYHTGPKLRASDQEINDLFKKFITRPVMVIVDVRPDTVGIPTNAHFAVEEIKDDGSETLKTFLHVPSQIEAEEAEEIGVEHLLRDIKDSTTTTLSTRVSETLASLHTIKLRITEIRDYLNDVLAEDDGGAATSASASASTSTTTTTTTTTTKKKGKVVDMGIVYLLQDVLNLLPDLSSASASSTSASSSSNTNTAGGELVSAMSEQTNDQLLVVYLSSLVRAVLALHALVENKASIGKIEDKEAVVVDGNSKGKKEKETETEKEQGDEKEKDAKEKDDK